MACHLQHNELCKILARISWAKTTFKNPDKDRKNVLSSTYIKNMPQEAETFKYFNMALDQKL
jgi:hypothetical protein